MIVVRSSKFIMAFCRVHYVFLVNVMYYGIGLKQLYIFKSFTIIMYSVITPIFYSLVSVHRVTFHKALIQVFLLNHPYLVTSSSISSSFFRLRLP